MHITQKVAQRQSQTLTMTRQLQQAIHLLELSNLELANYLEQAQLENPVLEALQLSPEESYALSAEIAAPHYDHENLWNSHSSSTFDQRSSSDLEFDYFHKAAAPTETLHGLIEQQICCKITAPKQQTIALALLSYLEPSGYLSLDYTELQESLRCAAADLEGVLRTLQTFEPLGIFARTLAECLTPQLRAKSLLTETVQTVLENLQEVAEGRTSKLLKKYHLSQTDFAEAMHAIQKQNPKPGLEYEFATPAAIIPDAYLVKETQGWTVVLNENSLPRLLVNHAYVTELSRNISAPSERKYLKENVRQANFLLNALKQRADTLIRVCTEIAKNQLQFFQYGIGYLKPMTLKEISERLQLHESTISRVTCNKYLHTPRGTFELKYFFTNPLKTVNGRKTLSSQTVKHRLKELIDSETKIEPLSDEALVDMMHEEGIQIARRTVAKYREAANIPSSYERKRRYEICHLTNT